MESKILYTSETIKGFTMSCLQFLLVGIWIGMGLGCALSALTLAVSLCFTNWNGESRRAVVAAKRNAADPDDGSPPPMAGSLGLGAVSINSVLDADERAMEELEAEMNAPWDETHSGIF